MLEKEKKTGHSWGIAVLMLSWTRIYKKTAKQKTKKELGEIGDEKQKRTMDHPYSPIVYIYNIYTCIYIRYTYRKR